VTNDRGAESRHGSHQPGAALMLYSARRSDALRRVY
jgi:hypothetical protein